MYKSLTWRWLGKFCDRACSWRCIFSWWCRVWRAGALPRISHYWSQPLDFLKGPPEAFPDNKWNFHSVLRNSIYTDLCVWVKIVSKSWQLLSLQRIHSSSASKENTDDDHEDDEDDCDRDNHHNVVGGDQPVGESIRRTNQIHVTPLAVCQKKHI